MIGWGQRGNFLSLIGLKTDVGGVSRRRFFTYTVFSQALSFLWSGNWGLAWPGFIVGGVSKGFFYRKVRQAVAKIAKDCTHVPDGWSAPYHR